MTQRTYARYVILSLPRVGSNMLVSCLQAHPNALSFREIYQPEEINWGYAGLLHQNENQELIRLRDELPEAFLEEVVFTPSLPEEISAVGFKLHHFHLNQPAVAAAWEHLAAHPDFRVVHLVRGNKLKQYASLCMARHKKYWLSDRDDDAYVDETIRLDPEDCARQMENWLTLENEARQRIASLRHLEISYEALTGAMQETLGRVQELLELKRLPLLPYTKKQRRAPIQSFVENYEELRSHFAGTPHADYFEHEVAN